MRLLQEITTLSSGQSYWKAKLKNGKTLCELDTVTDIQNARVRRVEWLEDVIGSDDLGRIVEVILCSPQGDVHIPVVRPHGAFQLNQGMVSLLDNQKIKTAQIVGSIENDAGDCVVAIWDALEQRLYPEFRTNVYQFGAWRNGVAPLGRLNIEALGVRL
jgi:hypothetical protein